MAALFVRSARPLAAAGSRLYATNAAGYSYQQALASTPETKVTTLSNGLRVATETSNHKTATVGLYIDAGSRFETAENNGTAHFLEHMAFKGTKRRTQQSLELEVEDIGAHLNAYTSREQTVYFAKCFDKDVAQCTDILADILQNSQFAEAQIERERGVILREMQEVNHQPEEVVFDYLHEVAFNNSALGRTILGPEKNVKSITRNDLTTYVKEHYTAPRIVLAAAGGISHEQMVELAEKNFSGLSSASSAVDTTPCAFTGSEVRERDDMYPRAHFALAVEGVSWSHPDFFPLLVASMLVGSWDRSFGGGANLSSPLAQITAKHNMAHSYMSFNTSYSDTGLWGIYGVCDGNTVEDFTYEVQQEWMRVCTGANEAEVERAKNQLKAELLFRIDGTTPICDEIGRQMLTLGRRMSPAELDQRVSAVDAKTVRDVSMNRIFDQCPAIAALGPVEGMPDYNRIRSGMFWLRV